jgi:hypothetical protein
MGILGLMPQRSVDEYVALARTAIIELLDKEHAASWLEVEAKITDVPWPSIGHYIDKHHVSTARIDLLRTGQIVAPSIGTRGGREVVIIHRADTSRRQTAIARAASRKRILTARYLGWAQGTPSRPGVVGPAGERAVHESLKESATFRLLNPAGGHVSSLLGYPLDGPLDHAVILTPIDDQDLPEAPVIVPIEVKNIRDWIYPSSQELYQLLDKAAKLQQHKPTQPIVPVLVCRRAHYTTYRMAKDLGFFVVQARRQYITSVDPERLAEVQAELGFLDLVEHRGPDSLLVHMFADVFAKRASESSQRWQQTAADRELCTVFPHMRRDSSATRRGQTLEVLRDYAERAGCDGGW